MFRHLDSMLIYNKNFFSSFFCLTLVFFLEMKDRANGFLSQNKKRSEPNCFVENEKLMVKNDEIAKIFNKHFSEIVDKLDIFEWPSCETEDTKDQVTHIIYKYKNHPRIKKIKSNYTIKQKFHF